MTTNTISLIDERCGNCRYYEKKSKMKGVCCQTLKRVLNRKIDRYIEIGINVKDCYVCGKYENRDVYIDSLLNNKIKE